MDRDAAVDPRRAARLAAIEQFQRDLVAYADKLARWEDIRADVRNRHPDKDLGFSREIEELRTSLLRRSGGVRPVLERAHGTPSEPIGGVYVSFWQLAFFDDFNRSRAHFA